MYPLSPGYNMYPVIMFGSGGIQDRDSDRNAVGRYLGVTPGDQALRSSRQPPGLDRQGGGRRHRGTRGIRRSGRLRRAGRRPEAARVPAFRQQGRPQRRGCPVRRDSPRRAGAPRARQSGNAAPGGPRDRRRGSGLGQREPEPVPVPGRPAAVDVAGTRPLRPSQHPGGGVPRHDRVPARALRGRGAGRGTGRNHRHGGREHHMVAGPPRRGRRPGRGPARPPDPADPRRPGPPARSGLTSCSSG